MSLGEFTSVATEPRLLNCEIPVRHCQLRVYPLQAVLERVGQQGVTRQEPQAIMELAVGQQRPQGAVDRRGRQTRQERMEAREMLRLNVTFSMIHN